jgi:hypothetical protein
MLPRTLSLGVCAAALFASGVARADVASPGERRLPSESAFTGLGDFPGLRFVVAVIPPRDEALMPNDHPLPSPVPVRDGEAVKDDPVYFEEIWALPADAPNPVTLAWLGSSRAPHSGSFSLHQRRVPEASPERSVRTRYHVRLIQSGWVALEMLSSEAVLADGSTRPIAKAIPRSFEIASIEAPPDYQLFFMPDPSWPRADSPPPVVPCAPGDVLPLSPGIRTLVAVQGAPGPDGSLAGKSHVSWGAPLHAWRRSDVLPTSPAVAHRSRLEVRIEPGKPLGITRADLYQDAQGRWFYDEEAMFPVEVPARWRVWAAGGAGAALLAIGAWVVRRRRRAQARI